MVTKDNEELISKIGLEDFGEIAVRACYICGKTYCKGYYHTFQRAIKTGDNFSSSSRVTQNTICLKCIINGLLSVCPDKDKRDEFLDLGLKTMVAEGVENKNIVSTNQKI